VRVILTLIPSLLLPHQDQTDRLVKIPASSIINKSAKPLGKGVAKTVFSATYRQSAAHAPVDVVLLFYNDNLKPKLDEVEVMAKEHYHPNLAQFLGQVADFPNEARLCLVQKRAIHGDLATFLRDQSPPISLLHKIQIGEQTAAGMAALHEMGFTHCDLAARNVLVYQYDVSDPIKTIVKVTDFGLVHKEHNYYQSSASTAASATPPPPLPFRWMAPEAIESVELRFSEAADLWSYGVVLGEILTNAMQLPYEKIIPTVTEDAMLEFLVAQKQRLSKPTDVPDDLWNFVTLCWQENRKTRPKFVDAVEAMKNQFINAKLQLELGKARPETVQGHPQGYKWWSGEFRLTAELDAELNWSMMGEGVMEADLSGGSALSEDLVECIKQLIKKGGKAGGKCRLKVKKCTLVKNTTLLNGLNSQLQNLHNQRLSNPQQFSTDLTKFGDAEKLQRIEELKALFVDCEWVVDPKLGGTRVLLAWHGCSNTVVDKILQHGVTDVLRTTDGGWFGAGAYLTPEAEYAAFYSAGQKTPTAGQTYSMVLCAAVVGLTYPITRKTDYIIDDKNTLDISRFHDWYPITAKELEEMQKKNMKPQRQDKALQQGFDSHFVAISVKGNKKKDYQAAAAGEVADYHELVLPSAHVVPLVKVEFGVN